MTQKREVLGRLRAQDDEDDLLAALEWLRFPYYGFLTIKEREILWRIALDPSLKSDARSESIETLTLWERRESLLSRRVSRLIEWDESPSVVFWAAYAFASVGKFRDRRAILNRLSRAPGAFLNWQFPGLELTVEIELHWALFEACRRRRSTGSATSPLRGDMRSAPLFRDVWWFRDHSNFAWVPE